MDRVVGRGLVAFRWAAWAWLTVVLVVTRTAVDRPFVAVAGAGLALLVTVVTTVLLRADPDALRSPGIVWLEVTAGVTLVLADGLMAPEDSLFATRQSLGSVWPLAGVMAAGVAFGARAGVLAGALVGGARVGAAVVNTVALGSSGRLLSLASTIVLHAVTGGVAGYLATLLRRAEREISAARAREEVARTLHDGVLQTLALIERRAEDPALVDLARDQERELRAFLFGDAPDPAPADVGARLRRAADRFERTFGGRAAVVLAPDLPPLGAVAADALVGAVGEALNNAGKHGEAREVTVYVEPDGEGVFCSVKDDGHGFDVEAAVDGVGLSQSIRGRVTAAGGRVELHSRVGEGTEVCLWVP